jgi:hypothetical protein
VKGVERPTIVSHEDGQDCFFLRIHSFARLQLCCRTDWRRAESGSSKLVSADSVSAAEPGFICVGGSRTIASRHDSRASEVGEYADPWSVGFDLLVIA